MNRNRIGGVVAAGVWLGAAWAGTARAWHYEGHAVVVERALPLLSGRVPAFFVEGSNTIRHCSGDPDTVKDLSPEVLKPLEGPEHYFNGERLGGPAQLPAKRQAFFGLCRERGISANEVGLLPYAVLEWTERLKVAFAEHRRRPGDAAIQAKILVYAGHLAHYAADLSQPLHLTVHHDGRVGADGRSPRTGLHDRVDALLGKAVFDPDVLKGLVPTRLTNAAERVFAAAQDRAPVECVYGIEERLTAVQEPVGTDPQVLAFCRDRLRVSVSLTVDLILTAWEDSESVVAPEWFERSHPAQPLVR